MNMTTEETRAFPLTHSFKMTHVAMIAQMAEWLGKNRSAVVQEALEEKFEREAAKHDAPEA